MNRNQNISDEKDSLRDSDVANLNTFSYSSEQVARRKRIGFKEWYYYLIMNHDGKYAVSFTLADNRYMGIVNCSVFDFETKEKFDCAEMPFMPKGKLKFPETSEKGDISFNSKTCDYHIEHEQDERHIFCKYERSFKHTELEADIYLRQPSENSVVITVDEKESCCNQITACMNARGYVKVKGRTYNFDAAKDFGVLNRGRGNWRYSNTRYWGIGCGYVNGKPFGYNIGYGLGDTFDSNENILFYDGKCHKLDVVDFGIPEDNIMAQWNMPSNDGRFDMSFKPFFNDHIDRSAGIVSEKGEKLFGMLNGTAVLDDGKVLNIENIPVFHEKVRRKW
ncbi:MAG: DUF2804 domain-containing protein [Acutalibacteraceae bacterium]